MVRSMTGYGRGSAQIDGVEILAEVRSVNHRYLDITVKAPKIYGFLEDPVKKRLTQELVRGKVDVYLMVDTSKAGTTKISLNRTVLEEYLKIFETLRTEYGACGTPTPGELARLPDVLGTEREEADEETLTADVLTVLEEALTGFCAMRCVEGERLREDVAGRLDVIEKMLTQVETRAPERAAEYREKLEARIRELLNGVEVDQQRLITETAIFADKTAVDEETVRLRSHIAQVREMLHEGGAVGRKLDFIVQEMNREANTIGSKSNDQTLTRLVVDIKSEIEKIREQVQNIE